MGFPSSHVYIKYWCYAACVVFKNTVLWTAFFPTNSTSQAFIPHSSSYPPSSRSHTVPAPFWWGCRPSMSWVRQGWWRQKLGRVAARQRCGAGGKPGRQSRAGLSSILHSLWDLECFPSSKSQLLYPQTEVVRRCGQGVCEFGLSYAQLCGLHLHDLIQPEKFCDFFC